MAQNGEVKGAAFISSRRLAVLSATLSVLAAGPTWAGQVRRILLSCVQIVICFQLALKPEILLYDRRLGPLCQKAQAGPAGNVCSFSTAGATTAATGR